MKGIAQAHAGRTQYQDLGPGASDWRKPLRTAALALIAGSESVLRFSALFNGEVANRLLRAVWLPRSVRFR